MDQQINILFSKRITARFKYAVSEVAFIQQKLGLPLSPKKPIVPFFRYMIEIRKSVVAQNPTLKTTEHVKLISRMWKSLDDTKKEKYYIAHQNEYITYCEKLAEYNRTVTKQDKQTVKEKRKDIIEEIEKRKYIRLQRKKSLALGKPKKPLSGFLKFLEVQADRQPNEKYHEYLRRKSFEWKNLSESQKEVFKAPAGDMLNHT